MSDVQHTVALLRAQADFLVQHQAILDAVSYETAINAWREEHPERDQHDYPKAEDGETPLCYAEHYASYGVRINVHGSDEEAKELTRRIRRSLGGEWKKTVIGDNFAISRRISEETYCSVTISVSRDAVCSAIREVKEVTVPAQEAQEAKEAVPEHTEFQEVIVDWDCGNLLTNGEPEPAVA